MKGLELSKIYYEAVIAPLLAEEYPSYVSRIAAGLVGEGSECYGYDDEISTDHDWGATVCLWLEAEDYEKIGCKLQSRLHQLPADFKGYPVYWIPGRNGVWEIGQFYKKFLQIAQVPQTIGQWRAVPEHHLSAVTNGAVFYDPLGAFTAIREDLKQGWPEDIRRKKIAARCMTMAQSGQYNYPRSLARSDKVAEMLALQEFVKASISMVYLLNNHYTPFYKWMHRGLAAEQRLGQAVSDRIRALAAFPQCAEEEYYLKQIEIINEICAMVIEELHLQELSGSDDVFLVAQGYQVHETIAHAGLRQTNPWVE